MLYWLILVYRGRPRVRPQTWYKISKLNLKGQEFSLTGIDYGHHRFPLLPSLLLLNKPNELYHVLTQQGIDTQILVSVYTHPHTQERV